MGKFFKFKKFYFFWTQYCSTRENKNFVTHFAYVADPGLPFIAKIKKMGKKSPSDEVVFKPNDAEI